jgi:hypothetical protein
MVTSYQNFRTKEVLFVHTDDSSGENTRSRVLPQAFLEFEPVLETDANYWVEMPNYAVNVPTWDELLAIAEY